MSFSLLGVRARNLRVSHGLLLPLQEICFSLHFRSLLTANHSLESLRDFPKPDTCYLFSMASSSSWYEQNYRRLSEAVSLRPLLLYALCVFPSAWDGLLFFLHFAQPPFLVEIFAGTSLLHFIPQVGLFPSLRSWHSVTSFPGSFSQWHFICVCLPSMLGWELRVLAAQVFNPNA